MSTLDEADIDVMKATKTCVAAQRFQYDYLNDDITDDGKIDYSLTDKIPQGLRDAIAQGKKILVLINPPYGEATNSNNTGANSNSKNKQGISRTRASNIAKEKYGKASNELYTQFLARIVEEIPSATIAIFSKLKHVNAPTLSKFRNNWKADFLDGFVVPSQCFEGLKGSFPIGFQIWKASQGSKEIVKTIEVEVLNKSANPIGSKTFINPDQFELLTDWVTRISTNEEETIPLKNAVTPATAKGDLRGKKWAEDAIGWLNCAGHDLQNASRKTMLFSSGYGSARGFFVTEKNLWKAATVFSVRRLIKPTWINDRDQFLQPIGELPVAFRHDCLMWMLFNESNLSASADGLEWDDRTWSIVNHFIPFTETEVNAPDRFESDLIVQYLVGKKLSKEGKRVMEEGRELWKAYFAHTDVHAVRDELKLNRSDVGWYQIRTALKRRNASGDYVHVDFTAFDKAYDELGDKLRPQVFDLGFLKP